MLATKGYAAHGPTSKLQPFEFTRREPGPNDILIRIDYCGVCHSDIHQARGEWGNSNYPMVPGHEIVGHVEKSGKNVKRFKPGDLAGIGCFVDSCRSCPSCHDGLEQYCEGHVAWTYNGLESDQKTPTYGGYSTQIVVDENYALKVSGDLPLSGVAPLLCAGITTYSPLRHFKASKGQRIGVVGLGGLGHMAVKFASSMGAKVTVFSTSAKKESDAARLGASDFVLTKDPAKLEPYAGKYDLIVDAVSASHDLNLYLNFVRRDGTMVILGVPEKPAEVYAFALIMKRRKLAGSVIGGIRETQEMLDYCAEHGITSDVEVIPIQKINEAYDRTIRGDVRYRFVIDLNSLRG